MPTKQESSALLLECNGVDAVQFKISMKTCTLVYSPVSICLKAPYIMNQHHSAIPMS